MTPPRSIRLLAATLLVALLGCNSANGTDDATSSAARGAAPSTQPHVTLSRADVRDADELQRIVTYLASDELEGRGVETKGLDKAADYIAKSFGNTKLRRLPGMKSYYQPFKLSLATSVGGKTRLSVGGDALQRGSDFTPMGISAEGDFEGPVAFVGYAIESDEHKYNDFDGVDLNGKVALALRYEPTNAPFDPHARSEHAALNMKAKKAAAHGAVALLVVNPPGGDDDDGDPDQLQPMGRSRGEKAPIPVVQVTRSAADRILKAAGGDVRALQTLRAEIDEDMKPRSFVLKNVTVGGEVDLEREQIEVKNVLAYVPGKGPRNDEYIVVGAHYDHLGRGESGSMSLTGRREIHNGADDNASGTAALMQIARHVAKSPPERSVIFIAFTGEERGLLGSAHFVNNPPVPLDRIVAMLNLDMVGRLKDNTLEVGGTGTAAPFDALVANVDEVSSLKLKPAASRVGGRGGVGPSDHASFAAKRIPVLFFWTGNHIDYHRPTDDADKVNYAGLAQVVDAAVKLIDAFSEMPRAEYVDKFDTSGMAMGTLKVRLGIMPDYSDESDGVRVGSTLPDTPAAKAGIRDGDVITRIGDDVITSLTDYMSALNKYNAGDTVKIGLLRRGEPMEVEATFSARRG